MPNYTTNLNLEKPLADEQYNIDVFNANADKIDQFAGQTPARALTSDELTTGAKINGVNFKGDTDIVTGAGFYYETVTYSEGNLAFIYNQDGALELHKSLVDNNIGNNPLTSTGYWEKQDLGGNGYEVGDFVWRSLPTQDSGKHLADGTRLSGDGIYKEFVEHIAELYEENPNANCFTTETDWQNSVSTYGSCGKFVYDSTLNTVRLPKVSDILQGTTDISALGSLIASGLPQHTHTRGSMNITGTFAFTDNDKTSIRARATDLSGAFTSANSNVETLSSNPDYTKTNTPHSISFDASRTWAGSTSNANYTSTTATTSKVQPQTIKALLYIVVATSTKTDIQVDIDEIVTDLNGKADTDLVNITDTGKVMLSGIGMPSTESISLTLGASGSTYIAPSNGYLYCRLNTTGGTGYSWVWLIASGGLQSRNNNYMVNNQTVLGCYAWVPVLKGQTVTINYDYVGNISDSYLRFVYAKGSESEAS